MGTKCRLGRLNGISSVSSVFAAYINVTDKYTDLATKGVAVAIGRMLCIYDAA